MKKTLLKTPSWRFSELFLTMQPLHQNRKQLFLFTILFLLSLGVNAQIFVSTTGNDANDGKSIANAKLTLAGAISAVGAEAVPYIKIAAGTFNTGSVAVPVGVRVVGEGVGQTVINMTASSLALQSNSTLSNVTITRPAPVVASGQPTTSVSTYSGSSGITIKNCKFEGNRTAIYLQGSNHVIIDNEFTDNRTGLVIDPSGTPSITGLVLERNQFYRNRSYAMIFLGAADGVTDANAVTGRIANNNFIENGAGGIELNVNNASTAVTLDGNHFAGLSSGVFAQRTNGGFTVDDHNSAATYPYNFADVVVDAVTYPNTVSGVAAGKFILNGGLNNPLNAFVSQKGWVSSNMPVFSSYVHIQDAIQYSNAGATINVDAGTYTLTDAIKLTKSITLLGNSNNLAAKPMINGVGNATNKSLVEVDAPNVTIQNFEFQIAQVGNALNGISTLTTDNFNNLTIADNIFKGTAAQSGGGFFWLSHAMKIGRGSAGIPGGVTNNLINIVRNSITYGNLAAPQLFGRGIYAYNTYGKIGGSVADANTILAIYALHGGEIGAGAGKDFEFSYNSVPAGLVSVVGAEEGNHKLSYNTIGEGILDLATAQTIGRHMEIKGSTTLGANIEIKGNEIKNFANIGLFIQRSNNVSVVENTFTPFAGANTFNSVVFSSKEGTGGAQSATTSQNLFITSNTFNGTDGTGITFFNHNASASVQPLNNAKIGGSNADRNTFAATLGTYIALDAQASGTTAAMGALYDVAQTGTNITNILPFNSNIDASNNIFGSVNTGTDRSVASLAAVNAKIFDKDDNVAVGDVILGLPVRNLTTGENFASIQSAIDDTDTQNGHVIDVDAGTYTLTTAVKINKEITLQGNANNLAAKPIINGVGNVTTKSLIEVDAPNVTVKNFELQIAQAGDALTGITTLATDNFNNLTIADNVFKGMKAYSTGLAYNTTAVNLGRQSASATNLVNVVRNAINYTNMGAPELFGKGIYAYNTYGKIGGSVADKNTMLALYSLTAGEIGGGASKDFEFSNNVLPLGGIILVGANVGNHKISDNVLGDGFASKAIADQFLRQIEIRGTRTAGANIEVANNQIKNYSNIGLFIQRSNNISVKNNTFSPITGANAFNSIVFSSKEGTGGSQSAATSDNLSITGNTLNGTGGKGVVFFNHNASASVKPLTNAKIGGADVDKNTFAATLGSYIDLDATASGTTAGATYSQLYDSPQTGMNTTDILPFNSDIDASYNVFGAVNSGTSTVFNDLVAAKAKISDGIDNAVTGFVNIQPQKAFIASVGDFTNGISVVPDDYTLMLKDDVAVYGSLGDRTLTKAHTFEVADNAAAEITFAKLTLNALAKAVTFTNAAKATDDFVLTEGKVNAAKGISLDASKLISFDAAKPANFVNGKVTLSNVSASVNIIVGKGAVSTGVGILNPIFPILPSDFDVEYFPGAYVNTTSFNPLELGMIHDKEYWTINATNNLTTASIKLTTYSFSTSGFSNFGTTDATTARFDSGTSTWKNAGNMANDVSVNTGSITSNPYSSYGVFTFAKTPIAVLPVGLLDFTAKAVVGGASVKWSTVKESNNVRFEIEKSLNGKDFLVVGTKAAANNATNGANYEFLDVNFTQSAYYRLVQVDVSGKRKTYNDLTKFVKGLDNSLAVNAYPNPVTTKLYVTVGSSAKENVKLLITDMSGKILKVKTADSSQAIELDVAGLASGSYILQVIKDSGNVSKKIIKL